MTDPTEEQIGAYYDRTKADWLREIPQEHQEFQRARYIADVQANPEAMRQLAEILERET